MRTLKGILIEDGADGSDYAIHAIIELIKAEIPEEPWKGDYKNCPAAWINDAYKEFRQKMLERLDKL